MILFNYWTILKTSPLYSANQMDTTSFQHATGQVLTKLDSWMLGLFRSIPNIIVAILFLLLIYFVAKFFRKGASSLFKKIIKNSVIENLLSNLIFILVIVIGVFISLGILNLNKTVTSLLAGAGIIGLALSFAFQDLAQNLISGISMAFRGPFKIGDTIEANGKRGVVTKLSLRSTMLLNSAGEEIIIPNKDVYQNVLINSSKGEIILVQISFAVSLSENLEKVKELTIKILEGLPHINDKSVNLIFTGFEGSSVKCEAFFAIGRNENYADAKSAAIVSLKNLFDSNSIKLA
jgi:small conductance mechanosensitive channel